MLTGSAIQAAIESGDIGVEPFMTDRLKACSYVLTLGRRFRRWTISDRPLKLWSPVEDADLEDIVETDNFVLEPQRFALGGTREKIAISGRYAAQISPLSHVARFGLGVTGGSDLISPGYGASATSHLTLELFNHNSRPLELTAGMPVAHLRVVVVAGTSPDTKPGIYEGKDPLSAPKLFEEWHERIK